MATSNDVARIGYAYDEPSRTHTWSFGAGIDDVVYTMPKIASDDPTAEPALANGYKQKIADAGALARDQKTGAAPTLDKRAEAMRTVATRLADEKQWNATAGAKPKLIDVDALIAAILAVKSKPEAGVRAYVESRTEDQRKNLANSKDFAEAYAIAVAKARAVRELSAELQSELDAIPDAAE